MGTITRLSCLLLLVQLLLLSAAASADDIAIPGTRWAVLIAGSNGYGNYRHQADVCHAYQIMKRGGLKDENIIVFMYDDIANNTENPRPGIIINHPTGDDVYAGVPKDYTGNNVTVNNFLAALLGNKSALTGGSGKVVDSGPDDHIFVYYTDHGGPGILGMPEETLYANDLVETLKKKHVAGTYKSMVFYLEACESGSIFEGLLPPNISVYATTASNAEESSWATYCSSSLNTCLGDLYSVAWMEDTDAHNPRMESLQQQYVLVKNRTANGGDYTYGSHVMQYGDLTFANLTLSQFMGACDNASVGLDNSLHRYSHAVHQRNADLVYFWHKYRKSAEGTPEKAEAQKRLLEVMHRRSRVDSSVELIGSLLFGSEEGSNVLTAVRPAGQPLVDDWDCLKAMVRTYEEHCGSLTQYGMKHMRSFANICNAGVGEDAMAQVASQACAL